jgi:hypothetical protein
MLKHGGKTPLTHLHQQQPWLVKYHLICIFHKDHFLM